MKHVGTPYDRQFIVVRGLALCKVWAISEHTFAQVLVKGPWCVNVMY